MSYTELSVEERATIQIGTAQGFSLRPQEASNQ